MDKITKVLFVVPPKVHLLDISGPAHIFYEAAEYGAPLQSFFVSLHKDVKTVTSSSGLGFSGLEAFTSFDLTPGDMMENLDYYGLFWGRECVPGFTRP